MAFSSLSPFLEAEVTDAKAGDEVEEERGLAGRIVAKAVDMWEEEIEARGSAAFGLFCLSLPC